MNNINVCCGHKHLQKLIIEKRKSTSAQIKTIPPNSVILKNLPHNPYLSSITGKYALNLSKINNFSVYFWKSTDNPAQNDLIDYYLSNFTSSVFDWSSLYKSQTINSLTQYTSFLNKTSSTIDSYTESDIVCVLADFTTDFILAATTGPYALYYVNSFVDNKIILFLNNIYVTNENIMQGGFIYWTLIHEFGHAFGLEHPFSNDYDSTIMPGIGDIVCDTEGTCEGSAFKYPSIAGYINDSGFNTIMSYNVYNFFLPEKADFKSSKIGYPQTLMPLDASALRWMYNVQRAGDSYISNYGVSIINPAIDQQKTEMIIGKNRELTFGSNCRDINFYFSNQSFKFNNIEPVKYQYNRILEKPYTFYPQDLCSTVATLNFSNTQFSNIFIERNALKTNLTVNCLSNTVLNVYIIDCKKNYCIKRTTYKDKTTGKKMTINNTSGATINVFFNK